MRVLGAFLVSTVPQLSILVYQINPRIGGISMTYIEFSSLTAWSDMKNLGKSSQKCKCPATHGLNLQFTVRASQPLS